MQEFHMSYEARDRLIRKAEEMRAAHLRAGFRALARRLAGVRVRRQAAHVA